MASRIISFLWGLIKTSLAQEDFILQGGLMQCNHQAFQNPNGTASLGNIESQRSQRSINYSRLRSLTGTPSNHTHELENQDTEMFHSIPPLVAESMAHSFGEADDPNYPGSVPSQHNLPNLPPQRLEITQSTSSGQAGIPSSLSNTQTEHAQMDVDTDGFNPRPYLLFMPTPMAPVQQNTLQPNPVPSHTQFLQQPQMPLYQTYNHDGHISVDVAPGDFNPRPYLRFMSTPMEPIQPPISESDSIMLPIQFQQQVPMALPQQNNGEQIPTNTNPYEFNPRPYLQYTPTAEFSQTSQEYHHSHRDMLSQQTSLMHRTPHENPHPTQADTAQGHAIDLQGCSPQMLTDAYADGFRAQQHHQSPSSIQECGNRSVGLRNHLSCSGPIGVCV